MTQEHYSDTAPAGPAGATATLQAETASRRAAAEIRGLMAARNPQLNAADLGPVLGLSRTAGTRRYNGDADFSLDELETIARWLNVPITRLIAPAPGHPFST